MLTARQQQILAAVVENFIQYAEPVGSRTISKHANVGYSAATVRNEMADLEEMGYLEQPHASAGRIPTNTGYRYYVDYLVKPRKVSKKDSETIRTYFAERINEIEHVFQQTAVIVSHLTNYTAIVLGPEVFQNKLKHMQLIPLSDRLAVAILVTDTGHVDKQRVIIPEHASASELEMLVNILNEKLAGVPLHLIRAKMYSEIAKELSRYTERYELLLQMVEQMITADDGERVYMGGATNLMSQPEFRDIDKIKLLYDLLEDQHTVVRLFDAEELGVQVTIGQENELEAVSHCSIITASYVLSGERVGSIGVLGPTRMDYGRLIGLMDFLSRDFNNIVRHLTDQS
ncbi:heat-inducible transcriptional repressor HrcA [Numidum massiliense]|uniref:heat-inducible transcriptional repressor HrcA n=1 Tax=Numidum massiliense TaxID=1522315 RepID=UPI0006D5449E|nr:heat-inducible transcriptional repressor HrcA [Numidum massiliense]